MRRARLQLAISGAAIAVLAFVLGAGQAMAQPAPEPPCGTTDSGEPYPKGTPDPRPQCQSSAAALTDPFAGLPRFDSLRPKAIDALTTFFNWNNFGGAGGGIYFDLTAIGGTPVTLVSWDVNISSGTVTVDVYSRSGTHSGFETSSSGWNLMGSDASISSAGPNNPTPVAVGGLVIPSAASFGIAMAGGPQWRYTNGNGGNQTHADANLQLDAGTANNSAFSSGTFSPRVWNGTVYYELGAGVPALPGVALVVLGLLLAAVGWRGLRAEHV